MIGTETANSKAKQLEDTAIATTSGLAKEIGGSPTTGNNRACFNRRVERTNIVVIRNQRRQIGPPRRDPYAMDVDRGRNYYAYGGFKYLARNCRNRGMGNRIREGRRLEYGQKRMIERGNKDNNNLNGDQDLILLD